MKTTSKHHAAPSKWGAIFAAFLATLLALPVNAGISIPDDPLTTQARVAPNILFILDDSGSMAFNYMPDSVPNTSTPNVASNAYTRNTLYYNPATVYRPWMRADGTRMTGGTSFNAVYGSFNRAGGGTIDLANAASCRRYNYNNNDHTDELTGTDGTQVCGGVQTFYVPKDTASTDAAYLGAGTNYYRYQITGNDVIRSEYGAVARINQAGVNVNGANPYNGTLGNNNVVSLPLTSVAANLFLEITISNTETGNNNRTLNYVVDAPGGAQVCGGSLTKGNNTTCFVNPTVSGQYQVRVQRNDNRSTAYRVSAIRYETNSCSGATSGSGWINCQTNTTPTGRTVSAEQSNYATWFSYHRSRMKAAKAGASEAFDGLDGKVRAGFRTIWGRNTFNIPVGDGNDGRFVNNPDNPATPANEATTSRTTWYSRMQNAIGYNGTPLRRALDDAGRYFQNTDATGPYGPQSVSQYACRQNFSILTTDGYWNDAAASTATGNVDDTARSAITGPNNQTFTYTPGAPYNDGHSNTLADVAMYYWNRDLRTDLDNIVPSSDANPAFWQHMVTFGISIGLKGTLPYSSVDEVRSAGAFAWPEPADNRQANIDDLLHAAVNGRGAFVAASNPTQFTEGLRAALEEISNRTSSYSNIASNSVSLETGTRVYSASYTAGTWTGQLTARAVSATGVGAVQWNSSIPAWGSRKVFTRGTLGGESFPTTDQAAALARSGGPSNYEVSGANNANYIKGDASLEERSGSSTGARLRNRTSVLGDIVSSSPAYVEDTNTIYVGANDGMLHAFDASNGQELFGYVPNILNFNHLATLSRGDYAHKFFVDGPITVSSKELTPNKHILVGTLGRGGKGLYALDVTNPKAAALAATDVAKWERSETPGNHMGLVLGKPILAKAGGSTAVVLGNGINSTSERAVLIVLDAETGAVIQQIDTGVGSAAAPNGLSTPTGAYEADGKTLKYVFAGDMQGNVWKFDLSNASSAAWTATRLFTATDTDGNAQPITSKLAIATHPLTRKRWVFFGTGRYLTSSDAEATNVAVQSMYGIIDESEEVDRDDLTQRTVAVTEDTVSGFPVRAFEAKSALPADSKGWYVNLPASGERIVQDAQVASGFLVTASMVPTGSACDADGTGYINALSAFTGTSAGISFFDLNNQNGTKDDTVGNNNLPVGSVNTGAGMPTLPNLLRGLTIVGGTSVIGSAGGVGIGGGRPRWERVSWIEVRRD
ncbi:pilus assembly protein [Pseudoxanthomonas sp. LH2527]|uniref:pilus assembly protein n=1 Tax=Pseudoxanthomonas sp. LH2527 TaxID=2923249 RepID=UPI001F13E2F8|nr:PilC/PilY family type IV pilus protein [Pseudoxanthomonas sp. LH2527]MCH6484039.1 pilus assembly protein [Pseudoxanthomonas sp. LH2527]